MTAAAVEEHCNFSFTMVIAWGMGRLWGLEQQRSYLVSHIWWHKYSFTTLISQVQC